MATVAAAFAALRARIDGATSLPLYWQYEDNTQLPDTPASFGYVEMIVDPGFVAGFGGGVGANLHRNPGRLLVWVFTPKGQGMAASLPVAESIAALLRTYRTSDVSCFSATVRPGGDGAAIAPPGMASAVNNYYWALVDVEISFDQIG